MDGYTFMDITIDLLNYKQASLRACNRLADPIAKDSVFPMPMPSSGIECSRLL